MPHIPADQRPEFDSRLRYIEPHTAGQLNYCLTKLCWDFLPKDGTLSYADLCEVQGVLHGVLAEFDRLVVGPYEDGKIAEHGSAYSD